MWKRLLVPHDFSPCADHALELALALARVHGAEITVAHVSELPANLTRDTLVTPEGASVPIRIEEYAARGARERLDAIAGPHRRAGAVLHTLPLMGRIVEEILGAATSIGADALIVGTHGRKGLSHLLVGSVAEKLVRLSPIPVVTARSRAPNAELTAEERALEDELSG